MLPMLPSHWPLLVDEERGDQFAIVKRILTSPKVERVVCATDAGREGELIFRQLYEVAGSDKPVDRLWISSLTPDAIRRGFTRLRPAAEFDPLAAAARARSRADWLVGMNLTRAYTLDHDEFLSVGRVQTPTLAMLVERELAIRDFVPEKYLEVQADFDAGEGRVYRGTYFRLEKGKRQTRLPPDGKDAAEIVARAKAGRADIESIRKSRKQMQPPLLYDLTELQRHANRLFGFSAKRTLQIAQTLYESHKAITYPRTDSRHLSTDVAAQLPGIAHRVASRYDPALVAEGTGERPLGPRFVRDQKVTDHHAIIPTGAAPDLPGGSPEAKVLDLVNRRLLQAWHGAYKYSSTTVITRIAFRVDADFYLSVGTAVDDEGWKVLDIKTARKGKAKDGPKLPGGLSKGQGVKLLRAEAVSKQTRPPRPFTEATLLTAMESAGSTLDSKHLSQAMKQRGLGTPATRASIIETLLKREYAERTKKQLRATDTGIRLLQLVHPKMCSPAMTGEWESKLREIERGNGGYDRFMRGIEDFVREVVGRNGAAESPPPSESQPMDTRSRPAHPAPGRERAETDRGASAGPGGNRSPASHGVGRESGAPGARQPDVGEAGRVDPASIHPPSTPAGSGEVHLQTAVRLGHSAPESNLQTAAPHQKRASSTQLLDLLRTRFGHKDFRPHQQDVCKRVTEGRDVLLVMPTGAGKSLCYQLPGIARGSPALVISPLIALMEDQTQKLRQQGFRAERIHSGRDRLESRQVCREYLSGELDFLYIAPERLAVPGFPELLARRTPGLVAIDEAHCISMWGHDFRPEYRRLRHRVPSLRPAPVIALTATATPRVQQDIIEQLDLRECDRSIHGFRRENLEIEIVELTPKLRPAALRRVLADNGRRPAIVYAPTRKASTQQAEVLESVVSVRAYHAGMDPEERDRVQADFLQGRIDVIVATIAFGMGIDKPDVRTVVHTGLPSSIEGYYQEIGRAGRDGLPSKAILLHSWIDRRTHEFFLERDYPPMDMVQPLFKALSRDPMPIEALANGFRGDQNQFEKAIEKLYIHGGLVVEADETAVQGQPDWVHSYSRQRQHKVDQLERMWGFTRSPDCRMLQLVRHFGDLGDSLKPCGHCDNCDTDCCAVKTFRELTGLESRVLSSVLERLRAKDGLAVGTLFRECAEPVAMERRAFERLIDGVAGAGLARIGHHSFLNRQGREVNYRRVALTGTGRTTAAPARQVRLPAEAAGLSPLPTKRRKKRMSTPAKARGKTSATATDRQMELAGMPKPDGTALLVRSALQAWRKDEARRSRQLPYLILRNQTLEWLAVHRPGNRKQLLAGPGIGPVIARRYGRKILEVIQTSGG